MTSTSDRGAYNCNDATTHCPASTTLSSVCTYTALRSPLSAHRPLLRLPVHVHSTFSPPALPLAWTSFSRSTSPQTQTVSLEDAYDDILTISYGKLCFCLSFPYDLLESVKATLVPHEPGGCFANAILALAVIMAFGRLQCPSSLSSGQRRAETARRRRKGKETRGEGGVCYVQAKFGALALCICRTSIGAA